MLARFFDVGRLLDRGARGGLVAPQVREMGLTPLGRESTVIAMRTVKSSLFLSAGSWLSSLSTYALGLG